MNRLACRLHARSDPAERASDSYFDIPDSECQILRVSSPSGRRKQPSGIVPRPGSVGKPIVGSTEADQYRTGEAGALLLSGGHGGTV